MKEVWITAAAAVTGLGNTLDETWQGLLAGRSAIAPVSRFTVERYTSGVAACIEGLEAQGGRSLMYPLLERLRRAMPPVPADSALIAATTKGGIDSLERLLRREPACADDFLAAGILRTLGGMFEVSGEAVNISAACASSSIAVARGAALIASGRVEAVLVVCFDLVSEFVFSGFSALQGLSPSPSRPFDRRRNGLTLGEGAAALLLMSQARAEREERAPLGKVRGWGVAGDANHITAPARDGCGLVQATRQALAKAGLDPEAVAAINAHGTGTVYNDLMELTAFQQVFGSRPLPLHSVKGAIGHTLGAAGGIEVALGLKTLQAGVIPPTVGLAEPEEGAAGRVSATPVDFSGDFLLTTNSGFGGVNAALVLEKAGGWR